MSQSQLSHPKYRPDIDGLRAIAVLSVVAFHAFPEWVSGGFIGVDVFFVISGYLISTIILENLERGTFSFGTFFARRIRRIFPALLIVLTACFAIGWFVLLPGEFKQLGKHIIAGAGFVANFALWNEVGYFDNAAETKPLLHLWSLGIEEQFYLIWPAVLWFAWKRKYNILTLTVLAAGASFALNLRGIRTDAVATFYSPQTRFWEMLSGSLLAWLTIHRKEAVTNALMALVYRERPASPQLIANAASVIGASLLAYGFWTIDKDANFPGKLAAIPVLGAVLIIAAGPGAWVNAHVLSRKFAVWFGLISFPLYLWHWPLLAFARVMQEDVPDLSIRTGAVALAVLLAWLTFQVIERPLRFGGFARLQVAVPAALMVAIAYAGFNIYHRDGLPFRLRALNVQNELVKNPLPLVKDYECADHIPEFRGLKFDALCRLSKDDGNPTIAFVGDSHMMVYRVGAFEKFGSQSIMMAAQTSCLPFATGSMLSDSCREKTQATLNYLERSKSVKTVVLAGYWAYLITGGFSAEGPNWRVPEAMTPEKTEQFKRNARTFLGRLTASGKKIILMEDVPHLDFNIKHCIDERPMRLVPAAKIRHDCSIDEKKYYTNNTAYARALQDVIREFPVVEVFDPRTVLCRDGRCPAMDGRLPIYLDGDHLNWHGSRIVINALATQSKALRNMSTDIASASAQD